MIYEGTLNQCEDVLDQPVPMYSKVEVEVPAMSGMFLPITTKGKILMKDARKFELVTVSDESGETPVIVLPGAGRLLKKRRSVLSSTRSQPESSCLLAAIWAKCF
jgi:hypothetical protein